MPKAVHNNPIASASFHGGERKAQCQRVLNYMRKHGSVTQDEAYSKLKVYRLSARIFDLRDMGYNIRTIRKDGENDVSGDKFSCAIYYLSRGRRAKTRQFPNAPKRKQVVTKVSTAPKKTKVSTAPKRKQKVRK